jgi:hypothetical protein
VASEVPTLAFGHAQAHEDVAQVHLHLCALVDVLRLFLQTHDQQGLPHGFQCPRRITTLQAVLGHAPMHLVVFFSTRRRQCAVVFRRRRLHMPLVFQQTGHGQPGLKACGYQRDGAAVTGQSLLVNTQLTAQVTGFQPAAVVERKGFEQHREPVTSRPVVTLHDQAAHPLQSSRLHLGVFLQRDFVGCAGLSPLPRLEMGIALVKRIGYGLTHFTHGG